LTIFFFISPQTNQGEKIEKPKNEGPVGEHIAQKNHSISDMFFFAIEKVVKDDPFIVGAREGNGELLELRLLETGFLSRFQLNP
jgi:hypothetical protein